MRRRVCLPIAIAVLASLAACARGQATEDEVEKAIAAGVEVLFATQRGDGGWGDYDSGIPDFGRFRPGGRWGRGGDDRRDEDRPTIIFEHGKDIAGLLGLAYAGVEVADKRLQKAMDLALRAEVTKNYVLGMRVLALAKLHDRLPTNVRQAARATIARDVAALAENQNDRGLWSYGAPRRDSDMGNTAMAIAALTDAVSIMKPRKEELWAQSLSALMDEQREGGRWPYLNISFGDWGGFDMGSTVANGLAGLLGLRTAVYKGGGCPCRDGKSAAAAEDVGVAIERSLEKMNDNLQAGRNFGRGIAEAEWAFFWARAAALSGCRSFGGQPWRGRLASTVIGRQKEGGWGDTVATGLSVAALATGREPVLVNKLRVDGQWNRHPDDASQLVRYVASQKGDGRRWQIVGLDAPQKVLHEAPILYLTLESAATLPDAERKALREFTDTGGTLLIEASCGDKDVADWAAKLCAELWPEWPLGLLRHEHSLWSADQRMGRQHPALKGIDDGVRTVVLVSERDLSCLWASGDARRAADAFRLGVNLETYATDRMKLADWHAAREKGVGGKYASQAGNLRKGSRSAVAVARIRHGAEWRLGANYRPWGVLSTDLERKADGLSVRETDPVAPGADVPEDVDLLYLTGRRACDLGEGGAEWLAGALAAGKFLLAEATLGDPAFDEPLRATLAAAGLQLKELEADNWLLTGQLRKVQGYDCTKVDHTPALAAERAAKPPLVYAITLTQDDAGRLVGLYSPYDILFSQTGYRAFGNRGYAADDARALATNIALLLSGR